MISILNNIPAKDENKSLILEPVKELMPTN